MNNAFLTQIHANPCLRQAGNANGREYDLRKFALPARRSFSAGGDLREFALTTYLRLSNQEI